MGLINKKEDWRGCSTETRQLYMGQSLNVNHPDFHHAMTQIAEIRGRCKVARKGDSILLLAGSGAGKSHLATKLLRASPRDDSGTTSIIPVVSFSIIPSKVNERGLAEELLCTMKVPMYNVGKGPELFRRAIKHLTEARTELIIIDNVQDIPRQRKQIGVEHMGNWIRSVIDSVPCLILMLGTPKAREIVESNAQLRSRALRLLHIPYFSVDTPTNAARFLRLLTELDYLLPLAERSCLGDPKIAHKLYNVTFGVFRTLLKLLDDAIAIALSKGAETITESDLADAFSRLYSTMEYANVFRSDVPNRLLDQPGEPFFNWYDEANAPLVARLKKG